MTGIGGDQYMNTVAILYELIRRMLEILDLDMGFGPWSTV